MASFIGNFTKKTIAAVFQDNFTNSLRTVLLDVKHCVYQFLANGSPGASQRGWVPNPGRAPSTICTENLLIQYQRLNPVGPSPLAVVEKLKKVYRGQT